MGKTTLPSSQLLFLVLCLALNGCMNAPLPPEKATLSAQFILAETESSEGIEVILPGTAYRGYTDREGRIVFDDLPAREYELLVEADGYQPYRESRIVLEPGDHIFLGEIALTPQRLDGEIFGSVRVEGEDTSRVEVLLLGSNQTITSASDGKFHFANVPVGVYQVTFYHPGAVAGDPIDVTIEAGVQTALSEIILKKSEDTDQVATGAIKGSIALEGSADFSGVTILVSGTGKFVESDPEGLYWVDSVPAGPHRLVFEKAGYLREQIAGVEVAGGTITEVTDVILFKDTQNLSPDATLRVQKTASERAIDPDEPGIIAGYAFYPDRADHSGIVVRLLDPPLETITDAGGAFLIEGVPPGLRTVRAEADGYQVDTLVNLEIEPGDVLRVPQMQLQFGIEPLPMYTSARLYGQVVDLDGVPLSGVGVVVERTAMSSITGRDGTFLIDRVPLGEYSVLFSLDGFEDGVASVYVESFEDVPIPIVTLLPIEEYLEVMTTIPSNGERGVEVSDHVHIEIQFSENITKRSVQPNISIFPKVASRIEIIESDTVAIDLLRQRGDGVVFDTEYTVVLGMGLESTQKHHLEEPYELRFTTGGPRILGSFPESGASGVLLPVEQPVILQFNTLVNMKDLQKITVRPNTGEIYNFVPRPVPYGHRVEMQMQLRPNRKYQITIPRAIRTFDGQRFENTPYRINFESGSYDDLTDPAATEEFLGGSGDPFGP